MNRDEMTLWARKTLDRCDQISNKEKKIEYAEKYGFLRGSIEFLLEHSGDVEFVVMRVKKKENGMDENECVDKKTE